MKCLTTDQSTAAEETGLCNSCYPDYRNQGYAREMGSRCDDVNPENKFVGCSENDAIACCICGEHDG